MARTLFAEFLPSFEEHNFVVSQSFGEDLEVSEKILERAEQIETLVHLYLVAPEDIVVLQTLNRLDFVLFEPPVLDPGASDQIVEELGESEKTEEDPGASDQIVEELVLL